MRRKGTCVAFVPVTPRRHKTIVVEQTVAVVYPNKRGKSLLAGRASYELSRGTLEQSS